MGHQLDAQAHPVPALFRKEYFRMKHLLSLQDMIDSPCKLMGKDGQRLCLAVFALQLGLILHGLRVSSEEKYNSFGEGPFKMGIADLLARGSHDLAGRFLGAFDQSAVRNEILNARKSPDVMYFVEDGEAKYPSDARD